MSVVHGFHSTLSIASSLSHTSHLHTHTHKHTTHTHTQRPITDGFGLEHPTQYFLESRGLRGGATVKSEQGTSVGAGRQQCDAHEDTAVDETMDMSAQDLDAFIDEDTMQ